MTDCIQLSFFWQDQNQGNRKVEIKNEGRPTSSDGGLALVRAADDKLGLTEAIAKILEDSRDPDKVTHSILSLLRQRVYGICQGYEDCNDHDRLRNDPMLACAVGREGEVLASQPTFSRFENAQTWKALKSINAILLDNALKNLTDKEIIVVDVDSTDDETHGQQELSFYHGYYDHHIYHPLIVTINGRLGFVLLRPGNVHASRGAANIARHMIVRIRERYPDATIIVRGDAGFAVPKMYETLESLGVNYFIGLITNARLREMAGRELAFAGKECEARGEKVVRFNEGSYRAQSWKTPRRVIYKAEVTEKGENPRFVVTNIGGECSARCGYEFYCDRGDHENRIKDFKNALKGDRTSCHTFVANSFRLVEHAMAYVLMETVRDAAKGTQYEKAQFDTIRLRVLKVAAWVKRSARRLYIELPKAFVDAGEYFTILGRLVSERMLCFR